MKDIIKKVIKIIRIYLKKYFPFFYNFIQPLRSFIYKNFFTKKNKINILKEFSEFAPNVSGDIDDKVNVTILNIKDFTKQLLKLSNTNSKYIQLSSIKSKDKRKLGELFNTYGSDKKTHEYDYLYEQVIRDIDKVEVLMEIGLGTNNINVMSNMSEFGKPGASLRAFRDYLPESKIIGLDIDKTILFSDERIETMFYDQHDPENFLKLNSNLFGKIDIIIDDGLHSIIANLNSIKLAKKLLKPKGYLIIEDIGLDSINLFVLCFEFLSNEISYEIFTNNSCYAARITFT